MAFTLKSLFRKGNDGFVAGAACCAIVEQVREPAFHGLAGVPDTPTGRFAMAATCREGMKEGGEVPYPSPRRHVYQGREPVEGALAALIAYMQESAALPAVRDGAEIGKGKLALAAPPGEE
jgi:hypothetical protein